MLYGATNLRCSKESLDSMLMYGWDLTLHYSIFKLPPWEVNQNQEGTELEWSWLTTPTIVGLGADWGHIQIMLVVM